jgi:metal-responsive CopG/Arc/MetJ family transcriptional regulator
MRTIVDIPEEQIQALKILGEIENTSRAELVRRAVAEYLSSRQPDEARDSAFGIWRERGQDGLEYQESVRREWDR